MPSTGYAITNIFAAQTGPLPLAQLDANFTQVANKLNDLSTPSNYFADSSGVSNLITVTVPSPLVFAYVAGMSLLVKMANTNVSSSVNINVNALGNKPVVFNNGAPISIGALVADQIIQLVYDGTSFVLISRSNSFNALTIGPSQTGGTLVVKNNNSAAAVTAQITTPFASISTSPLLSLLSTAAGGFATLSICGNNGTLGTNDIALFQDGTTRDGTLINRNSGSALVLRTVGAASAVNVNPDGTNVASFAPGSGGNAIIGISGNTNAIGFRTLTQSTVGAAGGASALPATPLGYMTVTVNGASVKVPYFNP